MIRVFPRRTKWTPTDKLAFVGDPPAWILNELQDSRVHISCTFTWDIPEAERLKRSWSRYCDEVWIGGPAYDDPGDEFTAGRYVKHGTVITSRGCIRNCSFCLVPKREGRIRELKIKDGWDVADNNLLACSRGHIERVFEMLRRQPEPIHFSGGLDARLFNEWHSDLLQSIRLKYAFFACDSPEAIRDMERVSRLTESFSREKKRCYVLVGYKGESPRQAEARLKEVYNLGFLPFAMLYRGPEATSRDAKDFHDLVGIWRNPRVYKMIMDGPQTPLKGGTQLRMA